MTDRKEMGYEETFVFRSRDTDGGYLHGILWWEEIGWDSLGELLSFSNFWKRGRRQRNAMIPPGLACILLDRLIQEVRNVFDIDITYGTSSARTGFYGLLRSGRKGVLVLLLARCTTDNSERQWD
jgi:hypothetical protein